MFLKVPEVTRRFQKFLGRFREDSGIREYSGKVQEINLFILFKSFI